MLHKTIITTTCLLLLTGCGHSKFDRGMSGASIGAATGAAVGAVTGVTIAQGAILGAAGGAITGLATNSNQINLGTPAWKKNHSAYKPSKSNSTTVRSIQSGLARKGYHPGPADGVAGKKTRQAIRSYQKANGLLVNGVASQQLASHIQRH